MIPLVSPLSRTLFFRFAINYLVVRIVIGFFARAVSGSATLGPAALVALFALMGWLALADCKSRHEGPLLANLGITNGKLITIAILAAAITEVPCAIAAYLIP